ncbi:Major facilitator superfamily domain general substrate transporter [Penicillium fimorum]|uniref:Major facilitator superfamily domain general substrate transporter n=1 Tax=Penicillium fimorum TaxID=1882269 RepID=A0A9X0CBG8_9EURO|nr:Major facilitator superfamily domain general substrate transporter [Penicillium fimorum]
MGVSVSSAAISNSPGVVAAIFAPAERGLAVMVYSMFPFLGQTMGPVYANFLAASARWRWVNVVCTVLSTLMFVLGLLSMLETYAPYILRRRAMILSKETGNIYVSKLDIGLPLKTLSVTLSTAITKLMAMAVYAAIIYEILYLIFAAFPNIFINECHWIQGVSGLSYIGIMIGQILAVPFCIVLEEVKYCKKIAHPGVVPTPEMRLPCTPVCCHSSGHQRHGPRPLGFAFPLFTGYMYKNLGTQWASSIPAFLSLAFTPLPFTFLRVGSKLRANSKFANEAKKQPAKLQEVRQNVEKRFEENQTGDNAMSSSDTEATVDPERIAGTIPTKSGVTAIDRSDSGSN